MANRNRPAAALLLFLVAATGACAEDVSIAVDVRQSGRPVSRYLTGACIEDVNHEIYGGIYSQMIFGESFQEPPRSQPIRGFTALGGVWTAKDGRLSGGEGDGPKLISGVADFAEGEAGVEVYLPGSQGGNAGLIVKVGRAGAGADNFDGYEISLDASAKIVRVGRHHHDWTLLKDTPCDVGPDRWISLVVKMKETALEVLVNGKSVATINDTQRPVRSGTIGLRQWQRGAMYRDLWVKIGDKKTDLPFEPTGGERIEVSGMWRPMSKGTAALGASIEKDRPFTGSQSQRITFVQGPSPRPSPRSTGARVQGEKGQGEMAPSGQSNGPSPQPSPRSTGAREQVRTKAPAPGQREVGIENRGLNRSGLGLSAGKTYEGYLWIRSEKPADVYASLENADGSVRYAEAKLAVGGEGWKRYEFTLTPSSTDTNARFAVTLKSPGSIVIGHAYLQPGDWGRFKGLPLRRDVVEGLIEQGVTVLRYGGSMVNAPEYRWKKMTGTRDRRPPYKGTWYAQSSNGWGIIEFLDLCEAAGFLGIPAFNMDETPQDMADFIEYANGPADSEWGRRRAADGHPRPYGLKHIQLGNEERVDDVYFGKFAAMAKAIWAEDARITIVVGDFAYDRPIADPMKFTGAASGITSLAAQRKILELARENGREVWFDVHIWTDGPEASPSTLALPTFIDAMEKIANGAKHKVLVFELNANNHGQRRALANAQAIGMSMRDGRLPIVCSANCLQVDGQNDNGWNQGLLFLNPSKVWLQPPGYVTRMISRNYLPRCIDAEVRQTGVSAPPGKLDVTATRSEDGKTVVLQVVNLGPEAVSAQIRLEEFAPSKPTAVVETLAGALDATNTAQEPERIVPSKSEWRHEMKDGAARNFTFPAQSFTVVRFE